MAKNWQYTKKRSQVMQVTMWLILGGMILLAGAVSDFNFNVRSEGKPGVEPESEVKLGPVFRSGDLSVRIPQGWRQFSANQPSVLGVWKDEQGLQTFTIYAEQVPESVGLERYLFGRGLLQLGVSYTSASIGVGGYEGEMIRSSGKVRLSDGKNAREVLAVQMLVSVLLPGRTAVTLRLDALLRSPADVEQLMRKIVGSVSFSRDGDTSYQPQELHEEDLTGRFDNLADGYARGL